MATDGIRYARVGDASIAYRVLGEQGPYLAIVLGPFPGLLFAEHPATRASVEWASRFGRPVVFDVQGSGRSDPLPSGVAASVELESEQLIAVLSAAGIGSAFILGTDIGGAVGVSVAVRRPDLVAGLVLGNAYARALRDDDYPWGTDRSTFDSIVGELQDRHGTGFLLDFAAPSVADDPEVREFWINCEQQIASPAQMAALARIAETVDVRPSCRRCRRRPWSSTLPTTRSTRSSMDGTSPSTFRMPVSSKSRDETTSSCGRRTSSSATRSRPLSPGRVRAAKRSAPWLRCCSQTSSRRPNMHRRSATVAGAGC